MPATTLLGAIALISGRWLNPCVTVKDADGERGRARLRTLPMIDEHLLRDIGFREEVSRFHRNRFPGF
ncbi:hypothetical protein [Neorhizobium galegae]|uniref:hypothetical protein n=1 Tax=Neorhizobium galegae TaxID=399 RepID=UPI0006214BE5|nr:hypothetical protein [Neorhizobium galegae]KAB1126065.1 hypothetical protein F4V90_02810 [Neorhizobium galegae]MCQ1805027.1 hypothetical protein [Neorhizobium galegae]CDZ55778.1 Hypothetical protein NGAL_HAMBI2566_03320 [Neorhizobium galegae bv. orientalis]CDZ60666.1 Hypothetical protein NGAL_HAMBI2605_11460 [Neorhizobium galegae bv. orientalis]